MSSVIIKGLYKKYENGTVAVSNFNADISEKEFFVILGPSGCGKSTLIRMIAGLEDITEGDILINDISVHSVPPKSRGVALVLKNQTLYPNMSVYENLEFGLRLRKIPKEEIERRIEQVVGILDIGAILDRKTAALSGGQRLRIAMGRAIVQDPKVFLLDEPLLNLDAKLRALMRSELKTLHRTLGKTVIYVTHDQAEAMELGSRILVMRNGSVQQTGTYQELYYSPVNLFVAKFIGSPQMNTCEAELFSNEGRLCLRFGKGYEIALPDTPESAGLIKYSGKKLLMGIRPTDILLVSGNEEKDHSAISMTVESVELLGTHVNLRLSGEGVGFMVSSPITTRAKAGDDLKIYLNSEKIHLFDSDSERRIN